LRRKAQILSRALIHAKDVQMQVRKGFRTCICLEPLLGFEDACERFIGRCAD
jgi:hypothetical protein